MVLGATFEVQWRADATRWHAGRALGVEVSRGGSFDGASIARPTLVRIVFDGSRLRLGKGEEMPQRAFDATYKGNAAQCYERYFVPAIGAPLAKDLVEAAGLVPGDRVLDVACGTGVVARLAAERVGTDGMIAGLDVNPAMLEVARSVTPADVCVDWHETSAEAMPLHDDTWDVVLCQMGLQFVPSKSAALREMHRVLAPEGRLVLNVPGPTPPMFEALADALARHIDPNAAGFAYAVFSLHDPQEMEALLAGASFRELRARAAVRTLALPPPAAFLWQYVFSTPLASFVMAASDEARAALERDVCESWQEYVTADGMALPLRVTTVAGTKSLSNVT